MTLPTGHCRFRIARLCAIVVAALAVCRTDDLIAGGAKRPLPQVPPGYTIELVAAPPLVEHPTMAGFDDRGRLYVAENTGENLPADELLANLPNEVRRLEDTDGDGVFDASTVFADKLTFPMGALFYDGVLYVASPPHIWRLEDTDDDGVADRREAIVGKFGFIGNAADIHGCFLGPDGRIYWTDGRHGHNFVDAQGNTVSEGLAARVFSCRPDGSDVQVYCGGGMDNPVELAFTEAGDMIGTMTFYNPDDARHDALMHFVHGGVYPRKHACVAEFKRTGELLTAISVFDVVAPSGVTRCRDARLGEEFRDAIFSTQFNTHKVVAHRLAAVGGTYASIDRDFLTSDDPDFHPTDVLQDADGSLLVVDTGGWFRIGCPTSQVAKPDIKGAIYRIRRTDAPPEHDPWGAELEWSHASPGELAGRLSDARPAVRDRAVAALAKRREEAIPALAELLNDNGAAPFARTNAVWTLVRIGKAAAEPLRGALHDADPSVRQAAARSLGTLVDSGAVEALCEAVMHDQPAVRREAAAALGKIGEPRAVPTLLDALPSCGDRFVEHALIYALIEINVPGAVVDGLDHPHPSVRRGALIALDQMDDGALQRDQVLALLETGDPRLEQAALEIVGRHPDWSTGLAESIETWLGADELTAAAETRLRGALAAAADDESVARSIASAARRADGNSAIRIIALEAMQRSAGEAVPVDWIAAIEACCGAPEAAVRSQAVHTAAALDDERLDAAMREIAENTGQDDGLRVVALETIARRGGELSAAAFDVLANQFADGAPAPNRAAAARALENAQLNPQQLARLVDVVATAGPLEAPALLEAFEGVDDAALAQSFIAALERSPGVASIRVESLRKLLESLPVEAAARGTPLLERLESDARERSSRLANIVETLAPGDASRGRHVFTGAKAGCTACHRVASEGGGIGPDLSRIGAIRTPRDLAESIVAPSASLARGYESYTVATDDGRVIVGVLGRETADAVHLRTADRVELRVPRSAIEEMAPNETSIMPQGFDRALSAEELADVIAYLQSLK